MFQLPRELCGFWPTGQSGPVPDQRSRFAQRQFSFPLRSKSVASGKYLFTSEAVSMGHPDKLADQISDGVLDALLAEDPTSRVACETMVATGVAIVAGEIT